MTARLEKLAALIWPRRCPFCGGLLGAKSNGIWCADCDKAVRRLLRATPRLKESEHDLYALNGAASAARYDEQVRYAVLSCKLHGHPWYARELADLIAVHVFGAQPDARTGRPVYEGVPGFPICNAVVPVPPRTKRGFSLSDALAARLAKILGVPLLRVLTPTRPMRPQKGLDRMERMQNTRGAYACRKGTDLAGMRILLVDDVITTGATASACALALLQGGAASVFAVSVAAEAKSGCAPEKSTTAQEENR